jgi:hypothetical protein
VTSAGLHPIIFKLGSSGSVLQVELPAAMNALVASFSALVATRGWHAAPYTLAEVMVACCEGGNALRPMYFQLAVALSSRLEDHLISSAQQSSTASAPAGQRRQRATGLAKAQAAHLLETRDRRLHAYHYAARQQFQNQQFLGFSVDFSRTGKRKTGVGCLTAPGSNHLGWCPPQAIRQGVHKMKTDVLWQRFSPKSASFL